MNNQLFFSGRSLSINCGVFLLLMSWSVTAQHLDVVGDAKIKGKLEITINDTDSSIYIGANAGSINYTANLENTFIGANTGNILGGGLWNTFIGYNAGMNNGSNGNTFIGRQAGIMNNSYSNIFIGHGAGLSNTGYQNTIIGTQSGYASNGFGHVFIGSLAGSFETGNNKLYIENSNSSTPLIYGEFDNDLVRINGKLKVKEPVDDDDAATKAYVDLLEKRIADLEFGLDYSFGKDSISDIDGNYYKIVKIGSQWWMAENLRTTKYSDGSAITYVEDHEAWGSLTSEGYCWYDTTGTGYNTYSRDPFGALYNWYAIDDSRKVCPGEWHIPTDAEWTALIDYLEGGLTAVLAMKSSTYWNGNNSSGLSFIPSGFRWNTGVFNGIPDYDDDLASSTWSSLPFFSYDIYADQTRVERTNNSERWGLSVRCIRD